MEEDEIASAILMLLEREKTLAEGAGAAALAALLQKKTSLNGAHTAVLVGGGNIDVTLLSRIIERGMVRLFRLLVCRLGYRPNTGNLALFGGDSFCLPANLWRYFGGTAA